MLSDAHQNSSMGARLSDYLLNDRCCLQVLGSPEATATLRTQIASAAAAPPVAEPGRSAPGASDEEEEEEELDMSNVDAMMAEEDDLDG